MADPVDPESEPDAPAPVPPRTLLALFIATCCVFALLGSREPPAGDSKVIYLTAESVALRGELAIKWLWPPMSNRGPDGKVYGQFAPLPVLLDVPGIWLRQAITSEATATNDVIITSHLESDAAAGLVAVVFYLICLDLGVRRRRALRWTCVLMFATTIAVYSRYVYTEIWQAAFALLVFREARLFLSDPSRRRTSRLGIAGGLLALTKLVYLLSIGPVVALLFLRSTPAVRRGRFPQLIAILAVAGAIYAGFNVLRWGKPFDTGYGETLGQLSNTPIVGLYGILFSAGKSIFLLSPPLVLAALAAPAFWRRHRDTSLLILCMVAGPALLACSLLSWPGDYAWGPRYMVFATPLLLLPCVTAERWSPVVTRGLVAFGVFVQVLGAAFYFTSFVWISHIVRSEWLGEPDRSGSPFELRDHNTHCGACYEDMHAQRFLPEFSQIYGHWWLLKSKVLDRSWDEAAATAPWSSNTRIALHHARATYDSVVFDWWLLDSPRHVTAAIALIVLVLCGLIWSARVLRRAYLSDA